MPRGLLIFFLCTVPGGSGSLQDAHRFAFLQAIMEKKWTTEAEARKLFGELANLSGEGIASSELEPFLSPQPFVAQCSHLCVLWTARIEDNMSI